MITYVDPPPEVLASAAKSGFVLPFDRPWARNDTVVDAREEAGYRCPCAGGRGPVVVLKLLKTPAGTFRVGQCPSCGTFTWAPPRGPQT